MSGLQVQMERQDLFIYRCQLKDLMFNEKHTGKFYSHMKRCPKNATLTGERQGDAGPDLDLGSSECCLGGLDQDLCH